MDKQRIVQALRAHEPELKAAGIDHLSLFGSVARNESSCASDIDLMAEFDSRKRFTLVSMVHLENRLSDILGAKVDLSRSDLMKKPVREQATRESALAF